MKRLLYYIPRAMTVTPEIIEKAGITGGIESLQCAHRQVVSDGPDGSGGQCFFAYSEEGAPDDASRLGYFRDRQTWYCCAEERHWIGYFNDEKPGPMDLEKPEPMRGIPVRFEDGNLWTVPIIRFQEGSSALGYSIRRQADGSLMKAPLAKYAGLEEGVATIFAFYAGEDGVRLMEGPTEETVYGALRMNYYVGLWEAAALGLSSNESLIAAAKALIEWPKWLKVIADAKKNESPVLNGSNTDSGVMD